jgi:hypothetical protein
MQAIPSFRAEAVQVERRFANDLQQKIMKVVKVSGTRPFVPERTQDAAVASVEGFLTLDLIHQAGCSNISQNLRRSRKHAVGRESYLSVAQKKDKAGH